AALRRVPRDAVPAGPAVLLDLVLAAAPPAPVQYHGGRGGRPRPVRTRPLPRCLLELSRRAGGSQRGPRLREGQEVDVPAAFGSAPADHHGRARHRRGTLSRLPPGTGGVAGAGSPGGPLAPLLRLPGPPAGLPLCRRAAGPRGARQHEPGGRLL